MCMYIPWIVIQPEKVMQFVNAIVWIDLENIMLKLNKADPKRINIVWFCL